MDAAGWATLTEHLQARTAAGPDRLWAVWLGRVPYGPAWNLQRALAAARACGDLAADVLLLLEHPPTYTLGRNARDADILLSREELVRLGVTVFRVDRGGAVTYHGPGQLVGYPIVHLRRRGLGIRDYIGRLEQGLAALLARYGITAGGDPAQPGVWVGSEKIAAIGVRCSRGVTTHGFALNVCTDLSLFEGIIPCGLKDRGVTSMARLLDGADRSPGYKAPAGPVPVPSLEEVQAGVADALAGALGYRAVETIPGAPGAVEPAAQRLTAFRRINPTLAGRSAKRRMK